MPLFKRKFKGMPVHVNPPPEIRKDRNEGRLVRLELKMRELERKGLKNTARYTLLEDEFIYRTKVKNLMEGGG